jgi:serine/threonine-protein kinase ULK/ATG1
MLEAVLDNDDDSGSDARRLSTGKEDERDAVKETSGGELDSDEEAHVRKSKSYMCLSFWTRANKTLVIKMITGRLAAVRKKQQMIAEANSKTLQSYQQSTRRRSGDITPRSVPSHASS